MNKHDEASPNGSNGSSPQGNVDGTGILEIDGKQYEYHEAGDEISVVIPDDLPDAEREALEKKADEFKNTLASAKRKAFEVNRERENLQREREELEREREQLRRERDAATKTTHKDKSDDMLKTFGVDTWDELAALQIDNPEVYHRKMAEYNAAISAQFAMNQMQHNAIERNILDEGYNPETVKAFAKANGITRIDIAFDYYKRTNEKPKGVSLADIQKKSVKFVPQSSTSGHTQKQAPGLADLYKDLN